MATSRNLSSTPVRLPTVQASRAADPEVRRALESIREWIEVRSGARGDPLERAATVRDLELAVRTLADRLSALEGSGGDTDTEELDALTRSVAALRATVDSLQGQVLRLSAAAAGKTNTTQAQIDLVGDGADAELLVLQATGFAFIAASTVATTVEGPDITFTAALQNVTGTATFTATAYTAGGTSLGTIVLGGTGNTRTLTAAQFTTYANTQYVTVVATLGALNDSNTVYRGNNGATGLSAVQIYMPNDSHTLAADSDGNNVNYTGSGSAIRVFEGVTELDYDGIGTTNGTWTATRSVTSGTLSTPGAITESGLMAVMGDHAGMTSDTAQVTVLVSGRTQAGDVFTNLPKIQTLTKSMAGATASSLVLTATGFAFVFPDMLATTASSPDQIDFTAALQNTSGAVTWAATGYDIDDVSTGAVSLTLQTATTCRLTKSNFVDGQGTTVRYVKVTATLGALSDTMTIYRGDNGSNAVQAVLSNEAHTLQANSGGTVSDYSGSGTTIRVYEGTTELVFDDVGAGDGTWRVSHVNSGISVGTKTDSGNYVTYGNASNMTANQATLTFTIQGKSLNGNNFTIVKVQSFAKSVAGGDGADGGDGNDGARGSLVLYSSSVSPAINLSGTTWPLDTSSPFGTNDNNALKIVWVALGNSAGSFVNNTVSHMRIGDTVTLVNSAGDTAIQKYWTGSYWADPGVVISGNLLVGGTISGATNLDITGSAKFEGVNSSLSVEDPFNSPSNVSRTIAAIANTSGSAQIGVYGASTTAGSWGVYGFNSATTGNTAGVVGHGLVGVAGVALASVANALGVYAAGGTTSSSHGLYALRGTDSASYAIIAEGTRISAGNAIDCRGYMKVSGQLQSTVSAGTAPFIVASTTEVANLNVAQLKGKTWAAPDPIGATTPSTGRFTTLRVDATPTASGANAATFSGLLPTGSAASTNTWMSINLNGTQYWIPVWVD